MREHSGDPYQNFLRPGFRFLEASREQETTARLDLSLDVVGEQVCRANVLSDGVWRVVRARVGIAKPCSRRARLSVELQSAPVLNDRFSVQALVEVAVCLALV